jgi:protein ImuB
MKRVAALFLPGWPIDRLRQAERTAAPPERGLLSVDPIDPAPLAAQVAAERANACSVPRGGGWRPGARWAAPDREGVADSIAALPTHQRPPVRELGRRSEPAEHPFKRSPFRPMPSDEGSASLSTVAIRAVSPAQAAPLVTSHRLGSQVLIAAACPAAQALGIRPGMPLTQARAQVPGLAVMPADPMGDRAALQRLALFAARRWSPLVALAGEDMVFVEIAGVAHLFGGEAAMARRIVRLLGRRGYTARVAIADTAGAAWALAREPHLDQRAAPGTLLCPPGGQRDALAPLPVAALRIDTRAVELMQRLGIHRIGDLLAMPRAPLVRRFGASLALRLDQALGHAPEPLDPVIPHEPIAAEQRFAEPIASAEAIAHWLGELIPRLTRALEATGYGARLVELVAERIDGVPQHIRVGLARPSRDPLHLLRLIARQIETIAPGYGIDALALHVRRAEPLAAAPVDARLDAEAAPDLAPLVDGIANRIGADRLWRARSIESDVPERSVACAAPLASPDEAVSVLREDDVRRLDQSSVPLPWHPRWPRPVRMLRRPERLDHVIAELPDKPPICFTWRGTRYQVKCGDGPERIHGEWWRNGREADGVRDYFRVEAENGQRFWLFRRGDGERRVTGDLSWFLQGVFG